MSDLVPQLRDRRMFVLNGANSAIWLKGVSSDDLCQAAADEIEQLRATVLRLSDASREMLAALAAMLPSQAHWSRSLRVSVSALDTALAKNPNPAGQCGPKADLVAEPHEASEAGRAGTPNVPEGWMLVPKVATEEMLMDGLKAYQNAFGSPLTRVAAEWSAMCFVAPHCEFTNRSRR